MRHSHVFPHHISVTLNIFVSFMPLVFVLQEETESTDGKANEHMKKPKGPAPQTRQKPKKESKKKR